MKPLIPLLIAIGLAACHDSSTGELDQERRRRAAAEQRAAADQESRDQWQAVALVTAAGAVVLLFVGAALGSKAKSDVHQD